MEKGDKQWMTTLSNEIDMLVSVMVQNWEQSESMKDSSLMEGLDMDVNRMGRKRGKKSKEIDHKLF